MNLSTKFLSNFEQYRTAEVHGRFLDFSRLGKALDDLEGYYNIKEIGRSFLNIPVYSITVGTGPNRILAWSQMHGNETTTTKGILDLLKFFRIEKNQESVKEILQQITLLIIPMVNPDGASRYTRENVNSVDLNRDALDLLEPESKVLRQCFEDFKPDFCFNLHDQRTIFGAGEEKFPATLSFLAPAMDEARIVTAVRVKAMQIIAAMNTELQKIIPKQVGRFDDSFNLNCTGDYFQAQQVSTILFECGHFPGDYLREETRKLFTFAFLVALESIVSSNFVHQSVEEYFKIPENKKSFCDVLLRNAVVNEEVVVDVAIQYTEKIKAGEVLFEPRVLQINRDIDLFGHKEIDCKEEEIKKTDGTRLIENDIVEVILLNKEKLSINSLEIQ